MKKQTPLLFLILGSLSLILAAVSGGWMFLTTLGQTHLPGCGLEDGCNTVLSSSWSSIAGVPVSIVGVGIYLLLVLSAGLARRMGSYAHAVPGLSLLVGLAALWFIGVQAVAIGAFCAWCCATHFFAVIGASLLVVSNSRLPRKEHPVLPRWSAPALAMIAMAGLIGFQTTSRTDHLAATLAGATTVLIEDDRPVISIHDGQFEVDTSALPVTGSDTPAHWVVSLTDPTCKHCRELHGFMEAADADTAFVHLPVARNSEARHLQHDLLALFRSAPELHAEAAAGLNDGSISSQPALFRAWINQNWNHTASFEAVWNEHREWAAGQIKLAMDIAEANKVQLGKASIPQMMYGDHIILGQPDSIADMRETFAMGEVVVPVLVEAAATDTPAFALSAPARALLGKLSWVFLFAAGLLFYVLRRRRVARWIALTSGVAAFAGTTATVIAAGTVVPENTIFTPQTDIVTCIEQDGFAVFSAEDPLDDGMGSHTPGLDLNGSNGVVRTYDDVQYSAHWNVNETDADNVIVILTLPPDPEGADDPDPDKMFVEWLAPLPIVCQRPSIESPATIANLDSYISDDGKTLVCNLGSKKEGTSGRFAATARVGLNLDGKVVTMDATIDTDQSDPVDAETLETTISGSPQGDWVKGNPETYRNVTNDVGEVGIVFVFPIALLPGGTSGSVGSAPLASTPLTIYDHAFDIGPNAVIADDAWFTNRTACGGWDAPDLSLEYDNDVTTNLPPFVEIQLPYGDSTLPGATPDNSVQGTITCSLDPASTANGYPVVRLDFAGYDGGAPPSQVANGAANESSATIAAQVSLWIDNDDLRGAKGDEGFIYNAISATTDMVLGTGLPTNYDGVPNFVGPPDTSTIDFIDILGSNATIPENLVADNNWRDWGYQITSTSGGVGKNWAHSTMFFSSPYQEMTSDVEGPDGTIATITLIDLRRVSLGGMGLSALPPSDDLGNWQGNHQVSRGETVTVMSSLGARQGDQRNVLTADQVHYDEIGLCNHIDNNKTELVSFASPTFPVAQVEAQTYWLSHSIYSPTIGGGTGTISDGPAFHVISGYGDYSTGSTEVAGRYGGIRKDPDADFPYVVEVATSATTSTAPAQSVAPGAVTCDDSDADANGWVAATNTAAMAVFETVSGSGVYDKVNMIRLRSLEPVPWRGELDTNWRKVSTGAAFAMHYNLRIIPDNSLNPDGNEIFVHSSRAHGTFTNGTFSTQMDDGGCGCMGATGDIRDPDGDGTRGLDWGRGPSRDDVTLRNPPPGEQWCNLRYSVADEIGCSACGDPNFTFDNFASEYFYAATRPVNSHHDKMRVGATRLGISKRNANGNPLEIVENGDILSFDICWSVIGSPVEPISDLRITDTLPSNMRYISATTGNSDNFTVNGQTLLWEYDSDAGTPDAIPGGTGDCFQITVEIIDGKANQTVANTVRVNAIDFFGDPLSPSSSSSVRLIPPTEEMCIYKTVAREEGPCDVYPGPGNPPDDWAERCSLIYQDDDMEFTLHLLGSGTGLVGPVDVIEVFPFLGDAIEPQNILPNDFFDGDGRAPVSDFSGSLDLLAWPPVVSSDTSNGDTQCRGDFYWTTEVPDLINRNPADPSNALVGGIWNTGTPPDLTLVTGFRYVMTDNLDAGAPEECRITFTLDSEDNVDLDFYSNTFGAKSRDIKVPMRANDVSILVHEFDLALTKVLTDPVGGFVSVGQDVTFDIEVCNQGQVAATQIQVVDYPPAGLTLNDPDWTPGTTPSIIIPGPLAPGECEIVPITMTVSSGFMGSLVNWAEIASAADPDGDITPDADSTPDSTNNDPFGGDNVTDNSNGDEDDHDPAEIFVLDPCIDVEKFTNGTQSDEPSGAFIPAGSAVTWTYVVNNCGNIGLGGVLNSVIDDIEGAAFYVSGDTDTDGILDTGEVWTFTKDGIAQAGQYSNTVQVTGDPVTPEGEPIANAPPVMDEDSDHYFGADPAIELLKTVYLGHNGGTSCPGVESVTSTNGAPITYCFVVTNTGNVHLDPVVVTDTMISPSFTSSNLGILAPGASVTVYAESSILGDLTNIADVVGTPVDPEGNPIPELPPVTDDDLAEVEDRTPDLALTKVLSSAGPFNPGDDVTFTITVFNQGNVVATSIVLADYVPVGFTVNDPDWAPNGVSGGSISYYTASGPLFPGDVLAVPITMTIDSTAPAGPISNGAEIVSASDGEGNPLGDIDSTPDDTNGNDGPVTDNEIDNTNGDQDDHDLASLEVEIFDLALIKVIDTAATPPPFSPGETITFTITVTNQGTMTATDIDVVDYIPSGLTLADSAWSQTGPNSAETTLPGPLAAGDSIDVQISFTIQDGVSGPLVNFSEIAGADDEDGNPGNDIDSTPDTEDDNDGPVEDNVTDNTNGDEDDHDLAPFTVEIFDLALVKVLVGNGPWTPGGPAVFEITVENQGTVTATNIQVTDYVPASLTVNDPAWSPDGIAGPVSTTTTIPGPLAPGATTNVTIEMLINPAFATGVITNFAEISAAQDGMGTDRTDDVDSTPDGENGNDGPYTDNVTDNTNGDQDDHDPAFLPVDIFDLALTKVIDTSVSPGPYDPGDSITFLINVCNQGSIAAYNVDVVDYLTPGLILNDPLWTNVSPGIVGLRLNGPVVPNGCEAVSITFTIDPAHVGGTLTNWAEIAAAEDVAGNNPVDLDSTPDTDIGNDGPSTDNATANENGDEDDHDPAPVLVGVFDLALIKVLDTVSTPGPYTPDDPVTFIITVTNQGTVVAQNIEVSDYHPSVLILNDPAWTQVTAQRAVTTIPGPLAPGASTNVTISFVIGEGVTGPIENWSEISEAEDDAGNDRDDIDSTDDGIFGNDGPYEDNVTDNTNGDEDDSDPAGLTVEIFDLALIKVLSSPGPFYPGATADFTITVENQGTVTAYDIGVSDYVPAGFIVADPDWTMNGTTGPVTADLATPLAGPLPPGATTNVVITLVVDPAATEPAVLTNRAEISSAGDINGPRTDDEDSTADSIDDDPVGGDNVTDNSNGDEDDHDPAELSFEIFDLALTKNLTSSGPYAPGTDITFTIELDNQGTVDAQNVVVIDYPPVGLLLNDPAWSGPAAGPHTTTYAGPLLAGTMDTLTITYTIDPSIITSLVLTNFSEIASAEDTDGMPRTDDIDSTADTDDSNDGPVTDNATDNSNGDEDDHDLEAFVVEVFDLALTKILDTDATPGPFQPGDTVTFQIEVFNQGTIAAQNIDVVDYIPTGLTLADPNWASSGPGVASTTIAGPIAPASSETVSITFTIDAGVDGPLENVAEIESAEGPDGIERDDNDSTPDADNGNDGPHVDNVTDNSDGDEDDADPAGITVGTFDLALLKENNDPGPFFPGGTVTFDITVFNQGTVTAYDIDIIDHVPPGLIVNDSAWVPNNIFAGFTTREIEGPLEPGNSETITITFTINPQLTEPIVLTNRAEITSATDGNGIVRDDIDSTPDVIEGNDPEIDGVIDNSDGDEDDSDPAPVAIEIFDLALTKVLVDEGPYQPGDLVTFLITVTNQGSVVAQNVEITDYVPAGLIVVDPLWSPTGTAGPGSVTQILEGPITPGTAKQTTITLQIDPATPPGELVNFSEISMAEDDAGNVRDDDIDSTADDDDGNDGPVTDNETGGDPDNPTNSNDEDDHDPAPVQIDIFDLALVKTVSFKTPDPYSPGMTVTFDITVTNQGTLAAYDIGLADYIPAGLTLADPDWTESPAGTANHNTGIAGPLDPGASITVEIDFTIDSGTTGPLVNFSEISTASDEPGGEPIDDIDSTPDNVDNNDGPVTDDATDNSNGDEDDHDPAGITVGEFDLALMKLLDTAGPYVPGMTVTYTITVENQGSVPAYDIEVVDYIPEGLSLADPDWTETTPGTARLNTLIPGPLDPGQPAFITIDLTIDAGATGTLVNFAEISAATDVPGGDTVEDVDSTPDDSDSNDGPVSDNVVTENGKEGGDEDDHDPAELEMGVFDLALLKTLASTGPFNPGDTITFTVTVLNQGDIAAYDIGLADYIPEGLTLADPAWTESPAGTAEHNTGIAGPLAAGGSTTVDITFTIDSGATGTMVNHAEISTASDAPGGDPVADIDSTPDADAGNDGPVTDNEIDNANGDEDDHDPASVTLGEFDLALTKVVTTPGPYSPGMAVTYTITVLNQGGVTAYDIGLADYIPAGLTLADANWTESPAGTAQHNTGIAGPLAPGGSTTVDITFTIDSGSTGSLVNFAEISMATDVPGGDPVGDTDSSPDSDNNNDGPVTDNEVDNANGDEDDHDPASITLAEFDLALTKEVATPGPYSPGMAVTYTITVLNQGGVTAYDIGLADYIPAGLTLADANWTESPAGTAQHNTGIAGPLAPGGSTTVDITFTIDSGSTGTLVNFAEISTATDVPGGDPVEDIDSTADSDDNNDGPVTDNEVDNANGDEDDHDPAAITLGEFDLALLKVLDTAGPYMPGMTLTYTITVTNQGTVAAYDIALSDYIPSGLTLADATWTEAPAGTASLNASIAGPLAPGGSTNVTIMFTIDSGVSGSVVNYAEINSATDVPGGDPVEDIDSTPDSEPNNDGPVTDGVTDNSNDDEDDHDPAAFSVGDFDLALIKVLDTAGPYIPGMTVRYTITVENQGDVMAHDIEVVDYIPAGLSLADAAWTETVAGTARLNSLLGPLAPGAAVPVTIDFTIDPGATGTLVNFAEISTASDVPGGDTVADIDSTPDDSDSNDGPVSDNVTDENGKEGGDEDDHDPAELTMGIFDLALTKTLASAGPFNPGDTITFTLTVFNQGDIPAYDIGLADYIPTGLTLADTAWTEAPVGTANHNTGIAGPLAAGASTTVDISFTIDSGVSGVLENFSEITTATDTPGGDPVADIDSTPDSDSNNDGPVTDDATDNENGDEDDHDPAQVAIGGFDLALVKTLITPGPYQPGDVVTFNIAVENQGGVTAYDIALADYIPAGLSLADGDWTEAPAGMASLNTPVPGPLAPGDTVNVTIDLSIDSGSTGTLVNHAEISAATDVPGGDPVSDVDSTPDNDEDNDGPVTDNVTDNSNGDEDDHDPAPLTIGNFDLALTKAITTAGPYAPGDTLTYTITVYNQGLVDAYDIQLSDYIPDGLTLADSNWSELPPGVANHNTGVAGPLAPGASTDVTISFTIDSGASGSLENTAEITSATDVPGGDPVPDADSTPDNNPNNDGAPVDNEINNAGGDEDDSDPAVIELEPFDLALIKLLATPGPHQPGDTITFTVTVTNQGGVTAYDISVVDYIPEGLTLADAAWTEDPAGTATHNAGIPGPLAPGASTTVTIDFTIDSGVTGTLVNESEIASATDAPGGDPVQDIDSDADAEKDNDGPVSDNVTDNTAGDEDDHDPAPVTIGGFDLALVKMISTPGPYMPGMTITYTITVENQGDVTAYDIDVADYMPTGLTLADNNWTEAPTGIARINTPIAGPLAPGASTSVTIDFTIDAGVSGTVENFAEISSATDVPGGDPVPDVDSTPDLDDGNDGPVTDDATDNSNGDEDDHDPAQFDVGPFDLALVKRLATPGPHAPGDTITFTITVTNQGAVTAYDVSVVDYIPEGLSLVDTNWVEGPVGLATFTTPIPGPLAPGASTNITVDFTIDSGASGTLINTAEISGGSDVPGGPDALDVDSTPDTDSTNEGPVTDDVTDGTAGDEDDSDPAPVMIGEFDLALTKTLSSSGPFQPGDTVTFTIQVINQGGATAYDIGLADYIPEGLTLADANWTEGPVGTATLNTPIAGPLAPGATTSVTIDLIIDSGVRGMVGNVAEISSATDVPGGDPVPDIDSTPDNDPFNDGPSVDDAIDNTANDEDDHDPAGFVVGEFDLALTKVLSSSGPFAPGDTVTFTITVINQGDVTAYDIALADYVPAGLTLADPDWTAGPGGIASLNTPVAGPLAPGASTTVDIDFTINSGVSGTLLNYAEISSATDLPGGDPVPDIDSTPDDDADNDGTPIDDVTDNTGGDEDDHDLAELPVGAFDLALTKSLTSPGPHSPGGMATFTITVINQGDVPAFDIAVVDYIPAGLTLADSAWNESPAGLASLVNPISGPLAPGDSTMVTIGFTINADARGTLMNHAEIASATDVPGGEPVADIDSTADNDSDNDGPVTDGAINNENGDEDDHDVSELDIIDLSIGSTVFLDTDDNGFQDANEPGIGGVLVEVLDAAGNVVGSDTTDSDGQYYIEGLPEGTYTVRIATPPASAPASSTPTNVEDDQTDGDDNGDQPGGPGTVVSSGPITLSAGGEPVGESEAGGTQDDADDASGDMTIDFGFALPHPGIQIMKTVVLGHGGLASCPGSELEASVNGAFVTYCFEVTNTGDVHLNNVTVTDNDLSPAFTATIGLMAPGETVMLHQAATIDGDLVNVAGVSGDPSLPDGSLLPLPNATDDDSAEVDEVNPDISLEKEMVSTSANRDGTYRITFELTVRNLGDAPVSNLVLTDDILGQFGDLSPANFRATSGDAVANPNWDGSASSNILTPGQGLPAGGSGNAFISFDVTPGSSTFERANTANVTAVTPGQVIIGESGSTPIVLLSLGNFVWYDHDNNGVQNDGEPAAPGVLVHLLDADGNIVQSDTTDAGGYYLFDLLGEGSYSVLVDSSNFQEGGVLAGAFSSAPTEADPDDDVDLNDNGINNADPDANGIRSGVIELSIGAEPANDDEAGSGSGSATDDSSNLTVDFGFYQPASIGDTVWWDASVDGIVNESLEVFGLEGVRVYLYDADGTLVDTVTTTDNGFYEFNNLMPGTYTTEVERQDIPENLSFESTPSRYTVTLGPGDRDDTQDYGYFPAPTAIELEFFRAVATETGVSLSWQTAWERDTLGYRVHRVAADGSLSLVNDILIIAQGGGSFYSIDVPDATGGRYVLEELENNLDSNWQSIVAYTEVDATPTGEPTATVEAEANQAAFTTSAEYDSYLVMGFDVLPQVLDITDPDNPRELVGEFLGKDDGNAVYFSAPAGLDLFISEREVYEEE